MKTEITVTTKLLMHLGACEHGASQWESMYPLRISIDPEKNLDIAYEVVTEALPNAVAPYRHNARSLLLHVFGVHMYTIDRIRTDFDMINGQWSSDPYLVAQALAMWADVILNGIQ